MLFTIFLKMNFKIRIDMRNVYIQRTYCLIREETIF